MYHAVTHESSANSDEGENGAGSDRKERVLHTRIPAVLENQLKAAAAALRVPVSNLVRTILEDAVALADRAGGHVEDGLERAARSMRDERARVEKLDPLADIVAYQPVVVAAKTQCARCGTQLKPGENAQMGVTSRPGSPVFVCDGCMPRRDSASS
jgi:hypothetical protein